MTNLGAHFSNVLGCLTHFVYEFNLMLVAEIKPKCQNKIYNRPVASYDSNIYPFCDQLRLELQTVHCNLTFILQLSLCHFNRVTHTPLKSTFNTIPVNASVIYIANRFFNDGKYLTFNIVRSGTILIRRGMYFNF